MLGRGDYFGEQALIRKDKRSANIIAMEPGVECLTLDRDAFKQLIGNLEELQRKDYGDKDRLMKKIIDNRRQKLISEAHSMPSSGECVGRPTRFQLFSSRFLFHNSTCT